MRTPKAPQSSRDPIDAGQSSTAKTDAVGDADELSFLSADDDTVDIETVREFIDQLEEQTTLDAATFTEIRSTLEAKREAVSTTLADAPALSDEQARFLLRHVFASRRHADDILVATGRDTFGRAVAQLLDEETSVTERFNAFINRVRGADEPIVWSVAGELLYHDDPTTYALWARWMWNPDTMTGVVPLMTTDPLPADSETPGVTYDQLCDAVADIGTRTDEFGLDPAVFDGPHGTHVAMATVHAVYVYLVLAMRMTKQFTDAIPDHEEYVRRLLGVHQPDAFHTHR